LIAFVNLTVTNRVNFRVTTGKNNCVHCSFLAYSSDSLYTF